MLFGLLALHESILRRQMGLGYQMQGFAAINALVLAKVMLVAEDLNLGGEMRGRALIYGVLWEAAMFAIVFIVFHVLEELVVGLLHGSTLAQSVPAIGGGGFIGLLTVAVILFVALIPYFAFRDITRVLGREKMRALLFTSAGAAGENPTAMKSQPPEKAPEP
ncbi:MAG TPA: hypothetical protein VMI52_09700 [Acetobacteraceae bacterium]|nr:hypothetical protein [Acetobacteraceae bacterium]